MSFYFGWQRVTLSYFSFFLWDMRLCALSIKNTVRIMSKMNKGERESLIQWRTFDLNNRSQHCFRNSNYSESYLSTPNSTNKIKIDRKSAVKLPHKSENIRTFFVESLLIWEISRVNHSLRSFLISCVSLLLKTKKDYWCVLCIFSLKQAIVIY